MNNIFENVVFMKTSSASQATQIHSFTLLVNLELKKKIM